MLYAIEPPNWKPPFDGEVEFALPGDWLGKQILWQEDVSVEPVFIGPLCLNELDCYLFGARFSFAEATIEGISIQNGYFLEYILLTVDRHNRRKQHRLRQHQSIIYRVDSECDEFVAATQLRELKCLDASPRWHADDANWPIVNGEPMFFVRQFDLRENAVTHESLTWDESLFVFWCQNGMNNEFKIIALPLDYQTAAQHYASE